MFNIDSQFSSESTASLSLIPYGTYRIRSKDSNTYLDCTSNGFVTVQKSNYCASQEWTISPAADGDYEIRSKVGVLRVTGNNQNHLVCNVGGQRFTWNIDPRGPDAYIIGDATNALAIQLPINGSGPVRVYSRNNETRQRWSLEPTSASDSSGGGSSGGNATVLAVPGFPWNVQPDLRSISDLPIGTQMMICGPGNRSYTPFPADFEALQVARWALDCFVSPVPITHPGGRGNYDAILTSPSTGWAGPYVFQRLLDIASLHPATRAIPIDATSEEVPSALEDATVFWDIASRNLLSFCFRLHQALVQAGAIVTSSLSETEIKAPLSMPYLATNNTGFPTGTYFEIRPKGGSTVLKTYWNSGEDGIQIHLYRRPSGGNDLRAAAFFIDRTGALCHGSGLNVDIVDNVPVLRHRRPVMNPPNHWSHPFPRFSYKNSQIQIKFYNDPALPSCSENLYPDESWRNSQFVLARNSQQIIHMHPLSDFQPWALRVPFTPPSHSGTGHNSDDEWRVVVEPISKNTADENKNTLWDIIPLRA